MNDSLLALAKRSTEVILVGGSRLAESAASWLVSRSSPFHVEPYPDDQYMFTVVAELEHAFRSYVHHTMRAWCNGDSVTASINHDRLIDVGSVSANFYLFDCALYLAVMSPVTLRNLSAGGWTGPLAKAAARFMSDYLAELHEVLTCLYQNQGAFTVVISDQQARTWMSKHRPDVDLYPVALTCPACEGPMKPITTSKGVAWQCTVGGCTYVG